MSNNNQSNYLFVLVAASAVGKSVLVNKLCEEGLWGKASKYSTRDHRGSDDDVVKIDNYNIWGTGTSKQESEIRRSRVNKLIEICGGGNGIVYYKNNNIYGISITEIVEGLKKSHLSVIISDFKVIERLKKDDRLKGRIKVMYLASTIDERVLLKRYSERERTAFINMKTINQIQDMISLLLSASRLKHLAKIEEVLFSLREELSVHVPYFDTIMERVNNIRLLYNRYIDNIVLIDYVILNFYDLEYMFEQARNILINMQPKRNISNPPIFMVCAAISSGKASLMEIIGDMGVINENIVFTTKYAMRDVRPTDGRDGMIAIGKNGNFKDVIERKLGLSIDEKDIWEWGFKQRQVKYAVCHKEIEQNIENGKAQIFISNMNEIENARKFYPNNIVVLYLHATHETATKKHIETKRRFELEVEIKKRHSNYSIEEIKYEFENNRDIQEKFRKNTENDMQEIKDVHNDFCNYNINIDHVLLNTGTRENLIEQITNLINHYSKIK